MGEQGTGAQNSRDTPIGLRQIRIAVVGEYIAGHVTFLDTLEAVARKRDDLHIGIIRLCFAAESGWERFPPIRSNRSMRASLRARARLRSATTEHDVVLIHTQTAGLATSGLMGRMPVVLSSDATPIEYAVVGAAHGHRRHAAIVEAVKQRVVGQAYRSAAAVVAWSAWTRRSLIEDYGVSSERIALIPAGSKRAQPDAVA